MSDLTAYVYVEGPTCGTGRAPPQAWHSAGTKVKVLEGEFGRIVLQPITDEYIDRLMGCLADGPDLLSAWMKDHRREGKRGK